MFSAKNEFIYNHYFTMDIIRIRKYAVKYAASIEDMTLERLQIFENLLTSTIALVIKCLKAFFLLYSK